MKETMPRVLFAAPKSGSGKTMIVCGMLEVMKRRKLKTASLKCGPDYIDPMFHRKVLGVDSGNLDSFFTDENTTRYLLQKQAQNADITLLEGVMGYYDGLGGQSEQASTYEIARITQTPVILIVDASGASVSLAALIKGMKEYRTDSAISGVILNKVSAGYYGRIRDVIEKECQIPVFGYVPEIEDLCVPSRHLGLISPEEMQEFQEWAGQIADQLEQTVCIDRILELAETAPLCTGTVPNIPKLSETVRLAVARDEAFSFYYKENMELLEQMGAELVPFSPLHDSALPEDIDGLLLGGGYPENNTKELSEAVSMRMEIKKALEQKLPCLAECGGFLYLQETLEGSDGICREMTGVLPGEGFRTKKLSRFGYIELENQTSGVFGTKGQSIRGHEFHYWDCTENGTGFQAKKPMSKICYPCMIHNNTMAAGFPHLYYYSNPQMIWQFLLQCQRYHIGRQAKRHWDQIAKPIDSLGLLEEAVVRICKISGSAKPYDLSRKALVILCADHGVVAEGVTQTDSSVTQVVSENFAKGCSTVNYMANLAKTDVYTVDVGMNTPPYPEKELKQHTVIDRKIARGTNNLAREAAMSLTQCQQALEIGKQLVRDLKQKGYQIIATGEMGIGNTTPSSALSAVFLNQTAGAVTGKGAGLSSEGMVKKQQAISQAMERVREKELSNPKAILAEIGGYEIAAMAGVFLGGMEENIPIVLDGAISEAAALTAARIDSRVTDFMIASHESKESIGKLILKELQLKAVLHADMCLGEGTGAMAMMPILDMAMEVYEKMGTFGEYQIDAYHRFEEEE